MKVCRQYMKLALTGFQICIIEQACHPKIHTQKGHQVKAGTIFFEGLISKLECSPVLV